MDNMEITKDNIEEVKTAERKRLRIIASVVVAACICAALLCVYAVERGKALHIGFAGAYPEGSDISELQSLVGSVVEDLGYSETYPSVVINRVDTGHMMFNNRSYKLLLLPAGAMRKYGSGRPDLVSVNLSDSESMRDIGLEDFCIVLIDYSGKTPLEELERLTAIMEALK